MKVKISMELVSLPHPYTLLFLCGGGSCYYHSTFCSVFGGSGGTSSSCCPLESASTYSH